MSDIDSIKIQTLKNSRARVTRRKKVRRPNKGQEKRCVDNFRHLGESEVFTPLGPADLVTPNYIIEFKIYTRAKDALGQILCYAHFLNKSDNKYKPRRKMLIVLFGKGLSTWRAYPVFERVCALYNVEVYRLSSVQSYKPLKDILKTDNNSKETAKSAIF